MELMSGEIPPCEQNIASSIIAATGRQLKTSLNTFHSLNVYRLLHSSKNPYILKRQEGAACQSTLALYLFTLELS